MQHMLLIYSDPAGAPQPGSPEFGAEMQRWMEYTQALAEAGILVGGDALEATTSATTVRGTGADALTTDGPFAETKEHLGGYYLLEVPNLDVALEWARKCPIMDRGCVEVRPVMPTPAAAPAEENAAA